MSHEDVVAVAAKTSMHEDIIREVEEIDWTIDPAEDENNACYGFDTVNDDSGTSQHDRATENDDDDFDVDELECVDEAAEDERRDQKPCDRGGNDFMKEGTNTQRSPVGTGLIGTTIPVQASIDTLAAHIEEAIALSRMTGDERPWIGYHMRSFHAGARESHHLSRSINA